MSIKRAPRPESNFYLLDKQISEDSSLTWAARGLLVFLLGKPDNWEVSTAHLVKQTEGSVKRSGRDAVQGIIKELMGAGYMDRQSKRSAGKFLGYDYIVREKAIKPTTPPGQDNPAPVEPEAGLPETDLPAPANPSQVSTDNTTRTDISNSRSIAKKTATNQSLEKADPFDELWPHYPKREGSNPKNRAKQNFNARLKEGHTAEVMAQGLKRYIDFCKTKGQTGTGFVMQAQRFFGTALEFLNDWAISVEGQAKPSSGMIDPSDTSWIHDEWGY